MGLSVSWIASKAHGDADTLDALGLVRTGARFTSQPVPPQKKFSAFELNGWLIVVSPDSRFASRERVAAASQTGAAVGAYFEEHVMVSGAFGASGGRLAWSAQHDPELGLEHLDVWGDPPEALREIRMRLLRELHTDPDDVVDYLFDAPTELAATVCGFNPNSFDREVDLSELAVARRDLMKLRDQPLASALADPAEPEATAKGKPSWLARLLGAR